MNRNFDDNDYSDVIGDSLQGKNPRIIDIALLGAHDAFSSGIKKGSPRDPLVFEQFPILQSDLVHSLFHRYGLRMVKAQYSYADRLLYKGVRYFDVRLSFFKDGWYTKHGLISDKLAVYLLQIIDFLQKHPKEFVIFDIQHYYVGKSDTKNLYEYIKSVKANGKCLFDFIRYDPRTTPIDRLDYNTVTDCGKGGGVVMLLKHEQTDELHYHYVYGDTIRSYWHNTFSYHALVRGMAEEYENLTTKATYSKMLRVNQSQLTGITGTVLGVLTSVFRPSLLVMAEYSNQRIIALPDFNLYLKAMPIFMVDFSDCVEGDFNNKVNKIISEYNSQL